MRNTRTEPSFEIILSSTRSRTFRRSRQRTCRGRPRSARVPGRRHSHRVVHATSIASGLASDPLRAHAVATTPAEATELSFVATATGIPARLQSLPEVWRGDPRIALFEAYSAFTRVSACTPSEADSASADRSRRNKLAQFHGLGTRFRQLRTRTRWCASSHTCLCTGRRSFIGGASPEPLPRTKPAARSSGQRSIERPSTRKPFPTAPGTQQWPIAADAADARGSGAGIVNGSVTHRSCTSCGTGTAIIGSYSV